MGDHPLPEGRLDAEHTMGTPVFLARAGHSRDSLKAALADSVNNDPKRLKYAASPTILGLLGTAMDRVNSGEAKTIGGLLASKDTLLKTCVAGTLRWLGML